MDLYLHIWLNLSKTTPLPALYAQPHRISLSFHLTARKPLPIMANMRFLCLPLHYGTSFLLTYAMPTQWTVSNTNSRLIFLTIQVISAIPSHAATVPYTNLLLLLTLFILTLDCAVYVLRLCMVLFKFLLCIYLFILFFKSYISLCTFYNILLFHA